ncbi:MAG: hypothetical protein Q4D58_09820 [Synergistaceae bacterium]|nr:hypothetical protein [Synergistaceae bacterium]
MEDEDAVKVINNRIVACSNAELFLCYLERGLDDVMPYYEYKFRCKQCGTVITEEEE